MPIPTSSRKRSRHDRMVLALPLRSPVATPQQCAIVLGRLVGMDATGEPLVDFSGNDAARPLAARTCLEIRPGDIGRQVALVFVEGDPRQPVVTGLLREGTVQREEPSAPTRRVSISIDGERLSLSAYREVVLECGKASIKMYRDGRLELRGTDLLSRSSAVNRIKGGSVKIN